MQAAAQSLRSQNEELGVLCQAHWQHPQPKLHLT